MTEKRYEVAVYDDKAINGYCVLDKNQASFTARLGYKNVFISSEYGCEIVARLLNDKEHTINELAKTIRIYDDGYIDLNKKYKKVVDENEQLKQAYQTLKSRHSLLHDECLEAECDRNSLKKDVILLEKENENLNNVLEDFMVMLNRLQANPDDEVLQSMAKDMLRMMGKDIMGDSE